MVEKIGEIMDCEVKQLLKEIISKYGAVKVAIRLDHESSRTVERWADKGIPKNISSVLKPLLEKMNEEWSNK